MGRNCSCGTERSKAAPTLGCIECGSPCCPSCAVTLESVSYCRGCARSLLGATTILAVGTYELH